MTEEIVKSLINNDEFINKVANEIADKIVIKEIKEMKAILADINKKMQDFSDEHKLIWEKFDENDRKFYKLLEEMKEEFKKRDEKLDSTIKEMKEEFKKRDEKFDAMLKSIRKLEKQNDQTLRTIANMTTSLEQEAMEHVMYMLKNKFNMEVDLYRLEIKNIEIDIYGENKDYVVIGEVKTRGGISTLKQFEKHLKIIKQAKPEINNKKLILIIYAPVVTKELVDSCREKGIYLTNGYRDFTELKLP
ncbi:hypothetical protein [Acidianus manzaensis]|uniref:DUF8196 domain-containing protein n=1 Tax=Acidianus manzaensis TaxID=282676 RepID=A0A1W6K2A0_9CREN|nr:hypothetical protein [Acidianus manzaensis]ARM76681.1 hypothetical protein B6F84_12110 [Acidianus manzaensis]